MREARTQQGPGARKSTAYRKLAAGGAALWFVLFAMTLVVVPPARAQDLSVIAPAVTALPTEIDKARQRTPSAFPKAKGGLFGPIKKIDEKQPLYLQGDELVYDTKGNRVIARGNVEIYYNNYILTADQVTYDQNANTLSASGNVTLKEPNGLVTRGERIDLTDDFRDGFVQSLSMVSKDETRIAAEQASRREGNVTEFQNGRFSPCKNDAGMPPLWCLSAGRIIHDQAAGTVSYQDAQFELFGMPVLYMPYFQHADPSVKRKSGFLIPDYINSSTLGFGVEVPYYFALNPSYDFTFHPMYTAKQGILWQGDWRQRLSFGSITGEYTVKVAAIDQNYKDLPGQDNPDLDGWRGSVETKGKFSLSSWWSFGWDVTIESDDTFRRFYKLDSILQTDRINRVYLTGLSDRNYFSAQLYQFGGLLLNDTSTSEARAHPVITYNYIFADPVLGGELSYNINALSFSRDLKVQAGASAGRSVEQALNRVVADVNWRRKFVDSMGQTYTPFANLRGDIYQITNGVDPYSGTIIGDETVTRGLATAGLLYAYPFAASTQQGNHVIEPLAQVIGRQTTGTQKRLPDEDSRSLVFDDTNLFEVDKFSGFDRMEADSRANVGLQYTFQANGGGSARILAGQSYHLAGENTFINPGVDANGNFLYSPRNGLETSRSDYVIAAYLSPSSVFRTVAQARFDEKDFSLRRSDAYGEFNYGPLTAQATYTYAAIVPQTGVVTDPVNKDIFDQQEIFAVLGLRLTDRWSVQASMRYDLDAGSRIQDAFQVRYGDECFVLTATYTETFIDDTARDLEKDRSLMLRFELKHLGQFRYKTDTLDHFFAENQNQK